MLKAKLNCKENKLSRFFFKLVNWIVNDHTLPDCQNDILLNITNHKRGILGVPKHEEIIEHTNHMHGKKDDQVPNFQIFQVQTTTNPQQRPNFFPSSRASKTHNGSNSRHLPQIRRGSPPHFPVKNRKLILSWNLAYFNCSNSTHQQLPITNFTHGSMTESPLFLTLTL